MFALTSPLAIQKTISQFFLTVLVLCLSSAPNTVAAQQCGIPTQENSPTKTIASASLFANAANRPGSLRYESNKAVQDALTLLEKEKLCSAQQCPAEKLFIAFSSTPSSFRTNYSDKSRCEKLFETTSNSPLNFDIQHFDNHETLSAWIGDFSQGKGIEGEKLYQRCPGSCSPQFTYEIRETDSRIELLPTAICGPARDKSDNEYRIEYAIRCKTDVVSKKRD